MPGYRLIYISIVVTLTVSLCPLIHVSHPKAQDSTNAVSVDQICRGQGNLALELTWSAQIALGSKMIFAANSLQGVATIRAYPLDANGPAVGLDELTGGDNGGSPYYAIVEEHDDDASWWELPTFQAYEIDERAVGGILNNSSNETEESCSIAFLGYGGEFNFEDDHAARISEFVLVGDPLE